MNTKTIVLDTMYTPYTLDTHSTFTLDVEENMLEHANKGREFKGLELLEERDLDFTYDFKKYLADLGENLVVLLNDNILDKVILKVSPIGSVISPKEYNYRTDTLDLGFEVDIDELNKYISDNKESYDKGKIKDCDGFWWLGDEEQTMINYYLREVSEKIYSKEAYYYDQKDIDEWQYVDYTISNSENCYDCKESTPIDELTNVSLYKDGRSLLCSECLKAHSAVCNINHKNK